MSGVDSRKAKRNGKNQHVFDQEIDRLERYERILALCVRDRLIIKALYDGILFDCTNIINRYIRNLKNAAVFIEYQKTKLFMIWRDAVSTGGGDVKCDRNKLVGEGLTFTLNQIWAVLIKDIDLQRLGLPFTCMPYTEYSILRLMFVEAYFPNDEIVNYYITCSNLYHPTVCMKARGAVPKKDTATDSINEQYFGFTRMRISFSNTETGRCPMCDAMFVKELIYLMCLRFDTDVKAILAARSNEIYGTIIKNLELMHEALEASPNFNYVSSTAAAARQNSAKYKRRKTADKAINTYTLEAPLEENDTNLYQQNDTNLYHEKTTPPRQMSMRLEFEDVDVEEERYMATHYTLCNDLANTAFSNVPLFVLHEDIEKDHKEMMYDLIMCIPYMLNRPKLVIHKIIRLYSTITMWDNRVLPMSYEGLFIYIQTMTTTHLMMVLQSVYEDTASNGFNIDNVTEKLNDDEYLYDDTPRIKRVIIEKK